MKRRITTQGRGGLAAGMLLAILVLAGCESAEDQEIRGLIEEIAALQEKRITVMETTADEEITDKREHDAGSVTETERQWEEQVQAFRDSHAETLTNLREALASGDWEIAYPEDMALMNGSPLAVVTGLRDLAEWSVERAEARRASLAVWREQAAENRARAERDGGSWLTRPPDPTAWMPRGEAPNVQDVLGRNRPER